MSDTRPENSYFASLFDPGNPVPRPVLLMLQARTLVIARPNGTGVIDRWPYDELRLIAQDEVSIEITSLKNPLERIEIEDPICMAQLQRKAPKLNKTHMRVRGLALALGGWLALMLVVLFSSYMALPATAPILARSLPWAWQENWGEQVDQASFNTIPTCVSPDAQAIIQLLANQIQQAGEVPFPIKVRVINTPYINMVALPGGRLVIFRGMIDHLEDSAQLAGLMTQSIGLMHDKALTTHILAEHGFSLLWHQIFGSDDVGATLKPTVADYNFTVPQMRSADDFTITVLSRLGIDITAYAKALRALRRTSDEEQQPLMSHYLITHPETVQQANLGRERGTGEPAMTPGAWAMLKNMCPPPTAS